MIDEITKSVRKARHKISASCDHDVSKLIEYYKLKQEKHRELLIETKHVSVDVSEEEKIRA